MDPNIQRLQIAQTLINALLAKIPAGTPGVQQVLDAANVALQAINTIPPAPPFVAPVLLPTTP